MARLTTLDLPSAAHLASNYGLELGQVEPLDAGSVNSNFRLIASDGKRFFLRIYEEQDAIGAERELRLLRELHQLGVPTVLPLTHTHSASFGVSEHQGKAVVVFPWLEGQIVCQRRVSKAHCFALGEALARVHQATSQLSEVPTGRFTVAGLYERLAVIERHGASFGAVSSELESKLSEYASRRSSALPQGLTHGDLFRDNVLWMPQEAPQLLALIDFESAARAPFVFDLMVCAHAWCYGEGFDLELARALVAGYERVRPLDPEERAAYRVEGALAALRFAITRITDFSLRAPEGTPPVRDYRRFLARLSALEHGELEPILGVSCC